MSDKGGSRERERERERESERETGRGRESYGLVRQPKDNTILIYLSGYNVTLTRKM